MLDCKSYLLTFLRALEIIVYGYFEPDDCGDGS